VLFCATVFGQNACQNNRLNDAMSGRSKLTGVNLGSWLVLEQWMSPDPWNACNCNPDVAYGEYLLEQCLKNCGQREAVMNKHWSSFITEGDFQAMSSAGINFARLPVGWWHIYDTQGGVNNARLNNSVSPTDYQAGGLKYIDLAFQWGQKYGVAILLCMHAAPGSQGGTDNSSPPDNSKNFYWDKYANNQAATVDSIALYAQRYGSQAALWGIALMNEPRVDVPTLQQYYYNAYWAVRRYTKKAVVINPLIFPPQSGTEDQWKSFMTDNNAFTNIYYDLHFYSCFGGPPDQPNSGGAIGYINWDRVNQIKDFYAAQPGKKVIIGEWAGANHFGDDNLVGFVNAQMKAYSTADGWSFWSWAGNGGGWKFQDMLGQGIDRSLLAQAC